MWLYKKAENFRGCLRWTFKMQSCRTVQKQRVLGLLSMLCLVVILNDVLGTFWTCGMKPGRFDFMDLNLTSTKTMDQNIATLLSIPKWCALISLRSHRRSLASIRCNGFDKLLGPSCLLFWGFGPPLFFLVFLASAVSFCLKPWKAKASGFFPRSKKTRINVWNAR